MHAPTLNHDQTASMQKNKQHGSSDARPGSQHRHAEHARVERKSCCVCDLGSVGGGKSTLVGRLLSGCNAPASLADEQGSTIDIGYC
jgi:hypothetical protein